ncbi:MAG TPA: histidine phosphatase family protein [Stellaceae bacterium]|nr:histidine phosphatase family protein [Stellaceae bacterium]
MSLAPRSLERPTRWWWVRHAPVTVNNGCVYGQNDLTCDCTALPAFKSLAAALPNDAVWVTSTLRRTHETAAAIIAAGLPGPAAIPGPDVIMEADLAEQHFGEWQGKSYTTLAHERAAEYHRFWLAPAHEAPPGGESFDQLVERTHRAVLRLTAEHAGRDIIAVTHGGTIRAALCVALGLPTEAALAFSVDNLSLTRLEHFGTDEPGHGHGWRVAAVNLPAR